MEQTAAASLPYICFKGCLTWEKLPRFPLFIIFFFSGSFSLIGSVGLINVKCTFSKGVAQQMFRPCWKSRANSVFLSSFTNKGPVSRGFFSLMECFPSEYVFVFAKSAKLFMLGYFQISFFFFFFFFSIYGAGGPSAGTAMFYFPPPPRVEHRLQTRP